jgi:hypothetical protein
MQRILAGRNWPITVHLLTAFRADIVKFFGAGKADALEVVAVARGTGTRPAPAFASGRSFRPFELPDCNLTPF